MPSYDPSGLRRLQEQLMQLHRCGVIPAAAPVLGAMMTETLLRLQDTLLAEIPAFTSSANPDVLPALRQHAEDQARELLRLFSGGSVGDFRFVRDHAQRRAEQHFPLEVVLHAYRCGHRVLSQWLREAALATAPGSPDTMAAAVADFSIEYTNAISIIAASDYVTRTRLLTEAEGDRRSELLNILLSGHDESDGRVSRLMKRAGYLDQRQTYCVIAAQAVNPPEMENPERVRRIIDAIATAITGSSIRLLAGVRNNVVTAVLSDLRRQSGWTAAKSNLSERIQPLLMTLGPSVLVGVSADHPSTSYLPQALTEAGIALDLADVTQRVAMFTKLPVRGLLVLRGAEDVRKAPPTWLARLIAADGEASGSLIMTLRAFADADMNMQQAARQLSRHPNTLYARFARIHEITGLDGQRYRELTELLLAADCWCV